MSWWMRRAAIACVLVSGACAAEPGPLASGAVTSDWLRLLGPAHNATSPETHLLHDLPKTGPRIVWEKEKGNGFGGPAISGERLVIFNRAENREVVQCLNATTGDE